MSEHPAIALVTRAERGEPFTVDEVDAALATLVGERAPDLVDSLLDMRLHLSPR